MDLSASYCYDDDGDERVLLLYKSPNIPDSGQFTETPEVNKSRWRSIRVMYLTMFLSSVSFSICMSSLYPYLRILDCKANAAFLGWVVASYSVGQLVASPFFGAWSNIRSRAREPLIVSLSISVLANILYMYLESIHKYAQIYLLIARTFIGFGAGNIAVVRSYVAGATTISERTSAMANLSAFQSVGFIFGNLLQTAMVPLGYPGPVHSPDLHIDMYSATGLFSAFCGVLNVVLLIVIFQEHSVKDKEFRRAAGVTVSNYETTSASRDQPVHSRNMRIDYMAVIPSIMLFFSVLFIFAVFETIVTPLGMDMFAWTKSKAILFVGIMLGCAGLVSIFVFVVIKILAKIFNERNLLLGGFIICLLGYGFYLPWGHTYPAVQYADIGKAVKTNNEVVSHAEIKENHLLQKHLLDKSKTMNGTEDDIAIENNTIIGKAHPSKETILDNRAMYIRYLSLTENDGTGNVNVTTNQAVRNESSSEAVGCPYYFDWCMYTPALSLWQYLLGTLCIAVGYPTCSVMSYTIFSKVLGPKPQGVWMGWLTASGSLARALGPVFVSQVYDAYGPRVAFVAVVGMIGLAVTLLLVIYKRLVPFRAASQTSHGT